MKITLIHPSLGRPSLGISTMKKWWERCDNKSNIEYLFILSDDDTPENLRTYISDIGDFVYNEGGLRRDESIDVQTYKIPNGTYINKVNFGCSIGTGDLFLVVSDDTDCPEHWDTLLIEGIEQAKKKKGISECYTVKCKDGIQPFLQTMQVIDRKWYEKFGYMLYSKYLHQYADTELTYVSHLLDRTLCVDILFDHLHYSAGKSNKDEVYTKNDNTYNQGAELFYSRLSRNFDIPEEQIINQPPSDMYRFDPFENQ